MTDESPGFKIMLMLVKFSLGVIPGHIVSLHLFTMVKLALSDDCKPVVDPIMTIVRLRLDYLG